LKEKKSGKNFLTRIYRFFIPNNFKEEYQKGQILASQYKSDILTKILNPRYYPTYWLGKGLRKLVDPKHKMKIGKEKE
jgi:hypothetical protein